jgi:hypothetical protein
MSLRKNFYTLALATLGLGGLPSVASAATFNAITDATLGNQFQNTVTAEGRTNGNLVGLGQFELDLNPSTANPINNTTYNWQSGVAVPFTLDYNSSAKIFTYTVGTGASAKTLNFTNTSSVPLTDIDLRTVAVNSALPSGSTILTPQSLLVNGSSITIPGGTNSSANASSPVSNLDIGGLSLDQGFTLTGTSVFKFTGAAPALSDESYQIGVGSLAATVPPPTTPEPASMSLMTICVGALAWHTRRRKHTV